MQAERDICALICRNSGIKAKEIAKELNIDREEVNHILYSSPLMKELCWQDRDYLWHGIMRQARPHSGLQEFSGYYGLAGEFLALDEAEWLRALPVPTGILAANDLTALQVVETCAEAGIAVPEQLAVLGIDNDELICGHARPPIATVEPNFYGAGFIAAATLQEMMEGHRAPRVVKVGESVNRIVARQSARPSSGAP